MNKLLTFLLATPLALAGCSGSDDNINGGNTGEDFTASSGPYFIAVRTPDGTEYALQTDKIEGQTLYVKNNVMEMPKIHYTWLFRNRTAVGMSYQQADPGVGYSLYLQDDGTLRKNGEFLVTSRFTNYDFMNDNTFVTSVGGQVSKDGVRNDGATFAFWDVSNNGFKLHHTKTIWTEDLTKNGQQVTFSSIVGLPDGTFLTSMVQSSFRERNADNGGSSVGEVLYPDSVWIARMDTALNVKAIYRDDRISYSAGHYRAQLLRQTLKTNDGTVYVFSNAYNSKSTRKAAALKLDWQNGGFDADYYFDLQTPAEGYKFRRVWYMTDHLFLLELYNSYTPGVQEPGHHFAVVDMKTKRFTKVSGLPAKSQIISGGESGGVPMFHKGYAYLPITKANEQAGLYKIDLTTGVGTQVLTIIGGEEIRSIGYLN